jgi:acetate kinase
MKQLLTINAGSSSLKVAAFDAVSLERIARVEVDGIGDREQPDHETALRAAFERLTNQIGVSEWAAMGHRVVHGGDLLGPRIVDAALRARLEQLVPLAPLHQPHCLAGIAAAEQLAPHAVQIACFDTSFHRSVPDVARRYALPHDFAEIEAYGFHGLSYEYIASVLPSHIGERARGRVIVAHLGSGASMCAMRNGTSIATTMGFTPLDGLVMGTRPGALDPGVVLYLIEQRGFSAEEVRELLYHRCGLYGVSGISPSMYELLASHDRRAATAIELFVYRAASAIGSLTAALGGLDALVFTAGIGEHSAEIRGRITAASRWIGDFASCAITTDEELVIARYTQQMSVR